MNRAISRLSPGLASGRVSARATLLAGTPGAGTLPRRLLGTSTYLREKCCAKGKEESPKNTAPPMTSLGFWGVKPAWKRASVNTLRCLVGCTTGDFAALWFLQAFYPDLGMTTIMAVSSTSQPLRLPQSPYDRKSNPHPSG